MTNKDKGAKPVDTNAVGDLARAVAEYEKRPIKKSAVIEGHEWIDKTEKGK